MEGNATLAAPGDIVLPNWRDELSQGVEICERILALFAAGRVAEIEDERQKLIGAEGHLVKVYNYLVAERIEPEVAKWVGGALGTLGYVLGFQASHATKLASYCDDLRRWFGTQTDIARLATETAARIQNLPDIGDAESVIRQPARQLATLASELGYARPPLEYEERCGAHGLWLCYPGNTSRTHYPLCDVRTMTFVSREQQQEIYAKAVAVLRAWAMEAGEGDKPNKVVRPPSTSAVIPIEPHGKRGNINGRMLDTLQSNPEASGWTVTQWTRHLKCSRDGVHGTRTWKDLEGAKKVARADRALSKRRNGKRLK